MSDTTIAVIGTGDMGSAVGRVLVDAGHRVITDLSGRSAHSVGLARAADMQDAGSLQAAVAQADLVLSILPPAAAAGFARRAADAIRAAGARPLFADCNAVSPRTVGAIQSLISAAGAACLDVGIVGPAPRKGHAATRFFAAGERVDRLVRLGVPEIRVIDLGAEIGRASALKATYAGLNKGTQALHATVLLAAERLGVRAELMSELQGSQPQAEARMRRQVPHLAATAERFAGEMREIASTYEAVGVTGRMHEGAAWLFELLAATPLACETRATLDRSRSLDEALAVFSKALDEPL